MKLSTAGGRLIIASDGIWDALSSDMAAKSCRGLPAELAARQVVKVVVFTRIPCMHNYLSVPIYVVVFDSTPNLRKKDF